MRLYLMTGLLVPAALACVLPLEEIDTSLISRHVRDITTNCGPDDIPPPNRINTTERLLLLREQMRSKGIQAYIIPLDDESRLKWISGFSGSAGKAVVTLDQARLWTDGRYFLQGSEQLDCNWYLMRQGQKDVEDFDKWIGQTLQSTSQGGVVGASAEQVGAGTWLEWTETLQEYDVSLEKSENLIDLLWTEDNGRPPHVSRDVVTHDMKWAGESWQDKVSRLRERLTEEKVDGMLVSELDEVAWLLNLRGEGGSHLANLFNSPLFESLVLVNQETVRLFMDLSKFTPQLQQHFEGDIDVEWYSKRYSVLETFFQDEAVNSPERKYLVTKPSIYLPGVNYALYSLVPEQIRELADSPILDMKSTKNDVEIQGMMEAHVKDAVALCSWAAYMENQIQILGNNWTEMSAAMLLDNYRAQQKDNKGKSFETISAFGSNGAVIHYRVSNITDKEIDRSNLYLVDSGGQYLDGTTDVTRTFHYGTPTEEQKSRYTDVLRGAIQLAMVQAPEDTMDSAVDYATRQFLFKHGLDYRHGTGHGIGSYLEVHEGPTRISMSRTDPSKLKPGIFFSDEPGFYKDGEFGIRLETILKVVRMPLENTEYGEFIQFEPVTLVPFEPKLIDQSQLSAEEMEWLQNYNQLILKNIVPRVEELNDTMTLEWILSRTAL